MLILQSVSRKCVIKWVRNSDQTDGELSINYVFHIMLLSQIKNMSIIQLIYSHQLLTQGLWAMDWRFMHIHAENCISSTVFQYSNTRIEAFHKVKKLYLIYCSWLHASSIVTSVTKAWLNIFKLVTFSFR